MAERESVNASNAIKGNLTGYDCQECNNRGYIFIVGENGLRSAVHCRCRPIRHNMYLLERSGLKDLSGRCTFDAWETHEKWQGQILQFAKGYVENPNGWFFVGGRSGSGKTHICTAISCELMKRGFEARYILWREFATSAKASINNDERYKSLIEPIKRVKVLYIDDFLKIGKSVDPSIGDMNIAFEILNSRYNDESKLTIISSEMNINAILELDEAVGSRIYQRSGNNCFDLTKMENFRIGGIGNDDR